MTRDEKLWQLDKKVARMWRLYVNIDNWAHRNSRYTDTKVLDRIDRRHNDYQQAAIERLDFLDRGYWNKEET